MIPLQTIEAFIVLSLFAATVNGGIGYGYSSISIPVALLFFASKILNPAYALVEAMVNTVMLILSGRKHGMAHIFDTLKRTRPIILALVPGVLVGSLGLSVISPTWIKLIVYAILLPLILLQAAGFRRPIRNEARAGLPLGFGTGLLYSLTTISGPPLALFWNNQGLTKNEFKTAVAQIRVAESYLTLISYLILGIFSQQSIELFTVISWPVLIGLPLGMFISTKVTPETFRRICMSFDVWIVGYGLSRVMVSQLGAADILAYSFWFIVIAIDLVLLFIFFSKRRRQADLMTQNP